MKKILGLMALATTAVLSLSTTAAADEAWQTARGEMIYLSDLADTAILQILTGEGETRYYFPGLASNFEDRSVHEGYWVSTEPFGTCGGTLVGKDGFASQNFGRVTIVFDEPAFPTGWTMLEGFCWEEPRGSLIGDL